MGDEQRFFVPGHPGHQAIPGGNGGHAFSDCVGNPLLGNEAHSLAGFVPQVNKASVPLDRDQSRLQGFPEDDRQFGRLSNSFQDAMQGRELAGLVGNLILQPSRGERLAINSGDVPL